MYCHYNYEADCSGLTTITKKAGSENTCDKIHCSKQSIVRSMIILNTSRAYIYLIQRQVKA